MSSYILALLIGFSAFMAGISWVVYYLMRLANDEDPGCINPGRHK
jgi:hypothetical protein